MRADLAGKSKTVSKVNDTLQQIFTLSSKFRIHDSGDSLGILKAGPPCRGGLSPQGEPDERMSAQRQRVLSRSACVWSQVAASREVLSGRKDLHNTVLSGRKDLHNTVLSGRKHLHNTVLSGRKHLQASAIPLIGCGISSKPGHRCNGQSTENVDPVRILTSGRVSAQGNYCEFRIGPGLTVRFFSRP